MAKYNYHELEKEKDTKGRWQVIRAITQAGVIKDLDPENIDITLTVNGVEIDFLEFTDKYLTNVNELIEARARAMAVERFNSIFDDIEYLRRTIQNVAQLWDREDSDDR